MKQSIKKHQLKARRKTAAMILGLVWLVIPLWVTTAQSEDRHTIFNNNQVKTIFNASDKSLLNTSRISDNAEHPPKETCQKNALPGCATPTFATLPDVTDADTPQGLAMADFNGDGRLDMVASGTGQNSHQVAVRFGNNDLNGTFQPPAYYVAGTSPGAIAVGDFDEMNGVDIAVANGIVSSRTRIAILLNQGNGTFNNVTMAQCQGNGSPSCLGGADQILNVAVGRIDNNSSLDLVVSDQNTDLVRIYFGLGNGTFNGPIVVDFPNNNPSSQFVTLADMDGDNDQDLVVALGVNAGNVQIKYNIGNGTGVFPAGQASVIIPIQPTGPKSIAIADFDGNGRLDFATANKNSTSTGNIPSVSVKLNNGSGGFDDAIGSPYLLENFGPNSITTGDFNLDGRLDLATANSTSGDGDGFSILLGNANGSFGTPFNVSSGGEPFLVFAGDITGDYRPDLILAHAASSGVGIGLRKNACDAVPSRKPFDFDGDGKSDVSVFRPSNGTWYLDRSQLGFRGLAFGVASDKLVPADYDGDGKTDVAVFRPSNGTWYILRSNQGFTGIAFGDANDIPVPADYDGDGKADVAVFRPSNGTWYIQRSQLGFTGILFGQNGDKPVPADYDGDGKADIAVNRAGTWYLQRSQLGFTGIVFGDSNDKLVPADYDGDGKADVAVFRPSNGVWYLLQSQAGFTSITFGLGTDLPVAADYDGDGKTDIAVFRNGTWYLNRTTAGFTGVAFGAATDKPIPNVFVP